MNRIYIIGWSWWLNITLPRNIGVLQGQDMTSTIRGGALESRKNTPQKIQGRWSSLLTIFCNSIQFHILPVIHTVCYTFTTITQWVLINLYIYICIPPEPPAILDFCPQKKSLSWLDVLFEVSNGKQINIVGGCASLFKRKCSGQRLDFVYQFETWNQPFEHPK